MEKIKLGVIGCSNRIKGLLNEKDFRDKTEVVALMDPEPGRIADFRAVFNEKAREYHSYGELSADPEVAWVVVAGWNSVHAEATVIALDAGKNVFTEKPVATTFADCLRLAQASRSGKGTVMVGFSLRYAELYNKLRQLLDDGVAGQIISMEFNENLAFNHGGHIMSCWRRKREFTGCHLLEKCCHDIDLANWMVGDRVARAASFGGLNFFTPENEYHLRRLSPSSEGHRAYCSWPTAQNSNPFTNDKDIVDNQVVILEYRNGVRATFHTNLNAAIPERRMYILGTEGAIRADLISSTIEYQRIGFDEQLRQIKIDAGSAGHAGGDGHLLRYWEKMMFENAPAATGLITGLEATVVSIATDQAMLKGQIADLTPYWEALDCIMLR